MRNLMLLVAGLLLETSIHAQIDGPFSGGTFSNAALAGSSQSWINTANATSSNNVYASFGYLYNPAGTHTDYLVATNF
ncbi:MAG: hypothetical protein JWM28_1209 [Chitinophagaceae bacterium]|nr:hypothetical protein [Chitinophagaceae bacterium]